MPMRDPVQENGGTFAMPSEIQNGAMLIGTLSQVECKPYAGPPHFSADGAQKQEWSIVWHFTLREHSTLARVYGNDGELYEMWRFTSDATSRGSFGRGVIEALAGREVTDGEMGQLLAADPDHMPTKLIGKSALLIMGTYNSKGTQKIGITQNLPLSKSDQARLQVQVQKEAAAPATPIDAGALGRWTPVARMGPSAPAQQFDQDGREVTAQPRELVGAGATANGSDDLPW